MAAPCPGGSGGAPGPPRRVGASGGAPVRGRGSGDTGGSGTCVGQLQAPHGLCLHWGGCLQRGGAVPCYSVPCYNVPCRAMLCNAIVCCAMVC